MLKSLLLLTLLLPYTIEISPEEVREYRLGQLLDKLAFCESSNRQAVINEKDYGSASFSLYQFKIETFVWAGRKYGLPHDDIWSAEQQRAIAKALIESGRGEQHWKVCFRKYKLDNYL